MVNTTGTLFEGYRRGGTGAGAWDEMFDVKGRPRPEYREILQALDQMTGAEFRDRTAALASSYLAQGITFDFAGEEKPFPLDAVPRVISPQDWHYLESGVAQRVRALEMFLADIYGPGRCIKDGVIPAKLISSSAHFHRQAHGIEAANGVRVMVAGIDVIRDEKGLWRVLEDNVRVPSGVSYVISNRRVMGQTLPELFFKMSVRAVGDYPHKLLAALRASAPNGIDDPTIVVLTPGVYNSAYYEHSLLARLMGVELVEGRDLFCTGGRVMMHTTSGPRQVDVIYRRIDDEFLDPLQFRPDSVLGAPGLIEAARRGNVTLANAIGNGVADDKLVYTYLPALMDYYLGEKPILPNVDTWRLEDPGALEEVFDRLDELCVKPVDGSGGKGLVMGPTATTAELDALRSRLRDDPRGWIAQPVVQLSTIPTLVEDGIRPRHADLRPFAVNDGEDVWVLPGGLTRVALPEGKLVVNSSQGGGSKDTWVLSRTATQEHDEALEPAVERIDVDAEEDAAERAEAEAEAERHDAEHSDAWTDQGDDSRTVEPVAPQAVPTQVLRTQAASSETEAPEPVAAAVSTAQDPTPADVRYDTPSQRTDNAPSDEAALPLQPAERPIVIHPPETSRLDQTEEERQQQQQQQQQARSEVHGC